jgi:hypothetical protein
MAQGGETQSSVQRSSGFRARRRGDRLWPAHPSGVCAQPCNFARVVWVTHTAVAALSIATAPSAIRTSGGTKLGKDKRPRLGRRVRHGPHCTGLGEHPARPRS